MVEKIKDFIEHELWKPDIDKKGKWHSILFRQLRIIVIAVRGFMENKIQEKASALTFYTLLSVVPTLALVFGIAKGFGLEERVHQLLLDNLQNNQEIWQQATEFSDNLLDNTQGGLIAGIGVVILLWSVMQLLSSVEMAFNDIWEIKKGRSFTRKATDYLAMVVFAPILLILATSLTVFIKSEFDELTEQFELIGFFGPVVNFFFKLLPYFFIWVLFTLLYTIMPNTRIKLVPAIIGAIIAGTGFQLFEWVYITLQIGVTRYNAIYGSFAALPLFLIWMQYSWLIVLVGAEISYANQNVENFQYEEFHEKVSPSMFNKLTIYVLYFIIKEFLNDNPSQTADSIRRETGIPIRVIRQILFKLHEGGFLLETPTNDDKTTAYVPAKDVNQIKLADVNQIMNNIGITELNVTNQADFNKVEKHLKALNQMIANSDHNILLKDL